MPDFTLSVYQKVLEPLQQSGYVFQPFKEFLLSPQERVVVLRHDVDRLPLNSLITAGLENSMGITGTYYFRSEPQSFDEKIIEQISAFNHEIGYHYENLSACKGNYNEAIHDFEKNLSRLRTIAPVSTICMHGSPLSKYDNRKIWNHYNYRDFDIIGEPYFDIDFSKVLYLTDTGRRWDGEKVSVRDKPMSGKTSLAEQYSFHSTFDIIEAAKKDQLPSKMMITVHPQRWTDNWVPWIKELVIQRAKNVVKKIIVWRHR